MNPVYSLLQKLPTNGWTTVFGAILAIVYGISGMATNHLDTATGMSAVALGLTGLGLGSKVEQARAEFQAVKNLLPPAVLGMVEGNAAGTVNQAQ